MKAIESALERLPAKLIWIRHFLRDTATPTVYRDVKDFPFGHLCDFGQKHHFMRAKGMTHETAYREGVQWICNKAYKASWNLRRVWKESLGYYPPVFVEEPLGDAFHALQDSFSASHVVRKKSGDLYVITAIHIYDQSNKETHSKHDSDWHGSMGKEAVLACRELTKIVVMSALQKSDVNFKQTWETDLPLISQTPPEGGE